jgi:hypothetical protein
MLRFGRESVVTLQRHAEGNGLFKVRASAILTQEVSLIINWNCELKIY